MNEEPSTLEGNRVGSPAWRRLLVQGAASFGFQLAERQVALFTAYAEELLAWNRRINLTTITAPTDIAVKHFIDSLPGAEALKPGWRVLDMGSGGGFPGIPLKIVRSDLDITLVDSVRKKVSFQKQVCRLLGLSGIHCVHARIEDLGQDSNHMGPYNAVVSRAFTDIEALCGLAAPLLTETGSVVAYRGRIGEDGGEKYTLPKWDIHNHTYRLPHTQAHRSITRCKRRVGGILP